MSTPYACLNEKRRAAVRDTRGPDGKPRLNGIDFLEVDADQVTLSVHFIHPLPGQPQGVPSGPALSLENVAVEGGARIKSIRVTSAESSGQVLVVTVDQPGDFSTYTLRLTGVQGGPIPPGFDPQLAAVEFSFKVTCPGEFDCLPGPAGAPETLPGLPINYLARDYASFRRLMLDHLSARLPQWTERSPADLGLALVEVMAYAADHLSYYQDAVATEAYLGTARRRISVRRHARLLDYRLHEGCNARAWVCLEVAPGSSADGHTLPAGTRCLTRVDSPRGGLAPDQLAAALGQGAQVFEALHPLTLRPAHNRIHFYTWSSDDCSLPLGATRATLRDDSASRLCLCPGDVLVVEAQRGPHSGLEADADPAQRQAIRLTRVHPAAQRTLENGVEVRTPPAAVVDPLTGQPVVEIEWHTEDALTFSLPIASTVEGQGRVEVGIVYGNVLLVDHGLTLQDERLVPEAVPEAGPHAPRLRRPGLTHRAPYDDSGARTQPAAAALTQDPHAALPAAALHDGESAWQPRPDLLGSDRFAREFVIEMDEAGRASVRFGDGVHGRQPAGGTRFAVEYRIGSGPAGNVGADAIAHVVTAQSGIDAVRNPMPARGGLAPESAAQARIDAPQAFRRQERAVTEADYAAAAQRHPDVLKAVATRRWTGSWHTLFITVDRRNGRPVDAAFEDALRTFLERFRLAAHDVEIEGPRFVPLDIAMTVCVAAGHLRSAVHAALLEAFSAVERLPPSRGEGGAGRPVFHSPGTAVHELDARAGRRGFFHPDNFTFGQPVYLSQVIAAAMQVPGVRWVDLDDRPPRPNRFRRYGQPSRGEVALGRIDVGRLEIVRLDNDPNARENGRIEFLMEGGL